MASELDIFGHTVATSSQRKKKKKMSFERRFVLYALLAGLFPLSVCELMLWLGSFSSQTQWTLTFFLVLAWLIGAFALRGQVIRPYGRITWPRKAKAPISQASTRKNVRVHCVWEEKLPSHSISSQTLRGNRPARSA